MANRQPQTDLTAAARRAYRDLLATEPDAVRPTDDELTGLALDELDGAERLQLADRVVTSAEAADSYRLLRDLHQEAARARDRGPAEAPLAAAPPVRSMRRWSVGVAAAVAATLVLAVGLVQMRGSSPNGGGDPLRSGSGGAFADLPAPADGAALATAPADLRWPAQVGATGYRVRLFDGAAELLWESAEITEPQLALASEARGHLAAAGAYFWVVDIGGPVQRRSLGPFWFRLGG